METATHHESRYGSPACLAESKASGAFTFFARFHSQRRKHIVIRLCASLIENEFIFIHDDQANPIIKNCPASRVSRHRKTHSRLPKNSASGNDWKRESKQARIKRARAIKAFFATCSDIVVGSQAIYSYALPLLRTYS